MPFVMNFEYVSAQWFLNMITNADLDKMASQWLIMAQING